MLGTNLYSFFILQVLECHSFVCKTEKAAMALVHACTHAYEHKEGWVEGEPPAHLHPVRRQLGGGVDVKLPGLVSNQYSMSRSWLFISQRLKTVCLMNNDLSDT